jgi:thiamine thiazole synthase
MSGFQIFFGYEHSLYQKCGYDNGVLMQTDIRLHRLRSYPYNLIRVMPAEGIVFSILAHVHYPAAVREDMKMDLEVTKAITESWFSKLQENLCFDAAIAGTGPSGLIAALRIAEAGYKVSMFESKLAPGGGMWGGAMMFSSVAIQNEAVYLLDELEIPYERYNDHLVTCDSVLATSALIYHAAKRGVLIHNAMSVEDVVFKDDRVSGVVVNWGPVVREGLHVDPLSFRAKVVVDATGHPCMITETAARKNNIILNTPAGKVCGERSLNAAEGEAMTVDNTKMIYPGLYVCGMAANGVFGSPRMGPVFGGMLLSGEKVAKLIIEELK